MGPVARVLCGTGNLDRHRQDDRSNRVVPFFHELDSVDRVRTFRVQPQVPQLLAIQIEGEDRVGDIISSDVVSEVTTVDEAMLFRLPIVIPQPDHQGRYRSLVMGCPYPATPLSR